MPTNNGFRTAYEPRTRSPIRDVGVSRTHQSFRDECDINVLMRRYMATGILPDNVNSQEARFLDCTESDFQSAMQLVAGASSLFNQLPSSIRNRFDNEPAHLLSFLSDESNRAEAEEMGLIVKRGSNAQPSPLQTAMTGAISAASGPANPAPAQKANP